MFVFRRDTSFFVTYFRSFVFSSCRCIWLNVSPENINKSQLLNGARLKVKCHRFPFSVDFAQYSLCVWKKRERKNSQNQFYEFFFLLRRKREINCLSSYGFDGVSICPLTSFMHQLTEMFIYFFLRLNKTLRIFSLRIPNYRAFAWLHLRRDKYV